MKRRNVDGAEERDGTERELQRGRGEGEDLKGDAMGERILKESKERRGDGEWAGKFTFNQIKEKTYFFAFFAI